MIDDELDTGWGQLKCDYFYDVCTALLGEYFATAGLLPESTRIGGVLFRDEEIFLEIGYELETAPNYSPRVIIGIGSEKYDATGQPTGVPAWSLIPDNAPERGYSLWRFSNKEELTVVLEKIRTEILDKYVRPLWVDKDSLLEEITKFVSNLE